MALHIGCSVISADRSEQEARLTEEGWVVDWLPDRVLDRNAAISAVMIADVCGRPELSRTDRWVVRGWLDELSLSPEDLRRLGRSPECLAEVSA